MHFTIPDARPEHAPEPPAMVSVVARSDVMWNRRVFKAPPLTVEPKRVDASAFTDELRRALRPEQRKK